MNTIKAPRKMMSRILMKISEAVIHKNHLFSGWANREKIFFATFFNGLLCEGLSCLKVFYLVIMVRIVLYTILISIRGDQRLMYNKSNNNLSLICSRSSVAPKFPSDWDSPVIPGLTSLR